jgi:hypothetical protein
VQITPDFKARKESKIPRRNKAKAKDAKQQQTRPVRNKKKEKEKDSSKAIFGKCPHNKKGHC